MSTELCPDALYRIFVFWDLLTGSKCWGESSLEFTKCSMDCEHHVSAYSVDPAQGTNGSAKSECVSLAMFPLSAGVSGKMGAEIAGVLPESVRFRSELCPRAVWIQILHKNKRIRK